MRICLLALLVACGPKKPAPLVIDDLADLDEVTLNALVAELAPLVAEAAGRPFPEIPHARVSRRADMEAILAAEFLDVMGDRFDAPEWVLRQLADDARAGAPSIVGKYGIQTGVLYLSPEAVAEVTAGVGLPPESVGDVARLVLAHEMVHALQAETMSWDGLADIDALDAMRGVTEGQANFVEQRVSERLGMEDARKALDTAQGWDEDGPKSAAAFETWALYGQGKAFVAFHDAHGGSEAVWGLIREPPAATSMLFRPETYAPTLPAGEDFGAILDGVEDVLTEGGWVALPGRAGEMALRQELFPGDALVDAALASLVSGTQREAFRSDRRAMLRVMRFADPVAARQFVELATRHVDPSAVFGEEVPWVHEVTPFDGVEADVALQFVSGPKDMGVAFEYTEVWIVRGDLVIQVRAERFRPGIRLREAVQTVLSRLDAP